LNQFVPETEVFLSRSGFSSAQIASPAFLILVKDLDLASKLGKKSRHERFARVPHTSRNPDPIGEVNGNTESGSGEHTQYIGG